MDKELIDHFGATLSLQCNINGYTMDVITRVCVTFVDTNLPTWEDEIKILGYVGTFVGNLMCASMLAFDDKGVATFAKWYFSRWYDVSSRCDYNTTESKAKDNDRMMLFLGLN